MSDEHLRRAPPVWLSWMRLLRLPAVFTALADIGAGSLLVRDDWATPQLIGLLLASACLYLGGMVLNDVFDIEQDRRERPQRPLPSGAISLKAARRVGIALPVMGVVFAGFASPLSRWIAVLLVFCVIGYDFWLKRTVLGPMAMGACRSLNLLLGASLGLQFPVGNEYRFSLDPGPTGGWSLNVMTVGRDPVDAGPWGACLFVALAMGIYIAGVTWFARTEARETQRGSLVGALGVVSLGLLLLVSWLTGFAANWIGPSLGGGAIGDGLLTLLLWAVVVASIFRRALPAVFHPTPATIQPAVGTMLLSILTLDALIILGAQGKSGVPYAVTVVLLAVPALALRRWMSLT